MSARSLIHGYGFARQRRFVNRARAVDHLAVNGYRLAGADGENIAHADFLRGDGHFDPVAYYVRRFGSELDEALQCVGRSALGYGFQKLAHRDEGGDHRRGFEIELVMVDLHKIHGGDPARDHPAHFEHYV